MRRRTHKFTSCSSFFGLVDAESDIRSTSSEGQALGSLIHALVLVPVSVPSLACPIEVQKSKENLDGDKMCHIPVINKAVLFHTRPLTVGGCIWNHRNR